MPRTCTCATTTSIGAGLPVPNAEGLAPTRALQASWKLSVWSIFFLREHGEHLARGVSGALKNTSARLAVASHTSFGRTNALRSDSPSRKQASTLRSMRLHLGLRPRPADACSGLTVPGVPRRQIPDRVPRAAVLDGDERDAVERELIQRQLRRLDLRARHRHELPRGGVAFALLDAPERDRP